MGIIITPPPSLLGREPKPPEQKPLLTTPPSDLDIRFVLDPLNIPQETKAKAWDDFYGSSDPNDFQRKFDAIPLPQEIKADLWDLRFIQDAKQTIDKRELEKIKTASKQKLTDITTLANEPTQSEFSARLMEKAGSARAFMLQEHQRRLQAGEYDETKRYRMARDLHEQIQNMDDSVTTALKEGITEVPFLRYLEKTDLLIQVKSIADKIENKESLTPGERALGEAYVTNLEAAGRYNPSMVTRIASTIGAQPAFWAEFAAMGGLAGVGRKLAVAGLEKVGATQVAKLGAEELTKESLKGLGVKGTAKALLGRGFVVTTGELARAVGIPMYAPETVERMGGGPGMGLRITETPEVPGEKDLIRTLDEGSQQGFAGALTKAFGGTAVETISEQAGGSLELVQSWLKPRILGKWLKRQGVQTVTSAAERLANKVGWNGVVGEVFEEEIANPFHAWLDGKGFTEGLRSLDPTDSENQKRVAEEFIAFGLTGMAGHKLAKPYNKIAQYVQQEMQARDENPGVEPPKVTPEERVQYALRGRVVPGEGAEPVVEEPTAQQMGLREARHRMKIRIAEAETARQEELPPISRRFQEAYEAQTAKSAAERYQTEFDKKESNRRAEQERQSELARKQLQPKRPYEETPKIVQATPEPEPDPAIVRVVEPNIDEWLSRPQTAREEFEAEVAQARQEIQERRAQRALAIVRVMMEEERQRGDELKRLADAAEKEEEQIRAERGLASIADLRRVQPDLDSTPKREQADASVQRMDELKRLAEEAEKEEERLRTEYGFRFVGRRQTEEPPIVVEPPVGGATEIESPTTLKRAEGRELAAPPIKPEIASKGRREIAEAPTATAAERLQTLRTELNNMRRKRRNAGPASDQGQVQQLDRMIADYERLILEHEKIVAASAGLPLYRQIVGETALRADKGAETGGTASDVVRAEQEAEGAQIPVPEGILSGLEAFPAHTVRWVTDKPETARSYTNTEEPLQLSPDAVVIASMGDGSHLVFDPGAPAPPAAPAVATAETEAKRIVEAAGHHFIGLQQMYGSEPDRALFQVQDTCYSDDTEVLTKRGWRRFEDVDISFDDFATRNKTTKEFQWQKATERREIYYQGLMYRFFSRSVDLLVSPNHRMLVEVRGGKVRRREIKNGNGEPLERIISAKELAEQLLPERKVTLKNWGRKRTVTLSRPRAERAVPQTSRWIGQEVPIKNFFLPGNGEPRRIESRQSDVYETCGHCGNQFVTRLSRKGKGICCSKKCGTRNRGRVTMTGDQYCAFMGMWLSEGWVSNQTINKKYKAKRVEIAQHENSKGFSEFKELIESIFGCSNYNKKLHRFLIFKTALGLYLSQFGHAINKYIPEEVMNATPRQIEIFWKFFWLGDGTSGLDKVVTASPRMADQLVELAQKRGLSASWYKYNDRRIRNDGAHFVVSVRRSRCMIVRAESVPYSGWIRCVSVPNEILYVRRNGKPSWCGNTVGLPVDGLTVEKVKARADRTLEDLGLKQAAEVKPLPAAEPGTFSEITDRSGANVPVAWGTSTVSDTTRGTEVNLQYAVVPASALGTSFNPKTFEPDPEYPQALQPRDRSRFASRDQFNQLTTAGAGQMNFERMADSRNAADGAPIVGDDLNVETRNMGTTALKWLYAEGSLIAGEYRKDLLQNLDRFGLGAVKDSVEGMQDPVLVRIRRTPMNMNQRAKFAAEANEPAQAAKSAVEQALEDARLMDGPMMSLLVPTEEGELFTRANSDFVRAFFDKVMSPADRGRYMRPDGSISADGILRIRNAVFAKAYPGAEDVLGALAEDPTGNIRNVVQGMVAAAPKFAVLLDSIQRGQIHNLDISKELGEAARKLSALRREGRIVEDYLNQDSMFGADISPAAMQLLRIFNEYARSAKTIREVLGGYADAAMRVGSTQQMGLLGPSEPPVKESILRGVMTQIGGPSLTKPPAKVSSPPGEVGPVRVEPPPVSAVTEPPVAIAAQAEPATTVVEPPPVGIPTAKAKGKAIPENLVPKLIAYHENSLSMTRENLATLEDLLKGGIVNEWYRHTYIEQLGPDDAPEVGEALTDEQKEELAGGVEMTHDQIEAYEKRIADLKNGKNLTLRNVWETSEKGVLEYDLNRMKTEKQEPRKSKAAPKTGEATEPPVQPGIEAKKGFWRLYTFVPDVGIRHVEDFPEKWTKKHGEVQKQNVQDSDEPLLLIDDKGAVVAKSEKWGDTGGRAQALRAPDWVTGQAGSWFTKDQGLANTFGNIQLAVDVPEEVAKATDESLPGRSIHVLPAVWSSRARSVGELPEQPPVGSVRLFRNVKEVGHIPGPSDVARENWTLASYAPYEDEDAQREYYASYGSAIDKETNVERLSAAAENNTLPDGLRQAARDRLLTLRGPQALRNKEMKALPGMEEVVSEQERQAGLFQREELEKRMKEGRPLEKGRPIEESPLFRGTEAAPQQEMFASTSDAEVTKLSVYAAMAKAAGGELVGIQKGMLGVGDKIAVQDQTGHMALVPIENASVQEIREALQAATSKPQALMTEKGTLAPGGDIERAWQVMSASLYKDRGPKVVVKELLQNAFDSLREVDASIDPERADRYQRILTEGQERKVTATVSRIANKIIVSDTGIGMTLSEFGNAFTNLFEAAKTGLVGRSGEFAVAKAAIFSIPDSLSVESVAYDPSVGRKMKVSFTSTPTEFFEGKVRPVTEEVSQSAPTGTTITATSKNVGWDAENFADRTMLSLQPPADVEVYLDEHGISSKPKAVSKPVSKIEQHIATVSFPGSSVEIWKSSTNGDHMFNAIAVEVNNNGIFQFFQYIRIDDNSKVWGAPNRIAVNIKATVPAGHVEYPFTASREDLRGNLWSEIAKHIDALILAPLRMKTRDYIQNRYDNLPLIETKQGNAPFYDLGLRLTPGETKTVLQLGSMKDIAGALQEVAHRMQAALMEQPLEEWGIKRYSWDKESPLPLGSGISRVGVFFSEPGYHGVHIPNLSAPPGSREATILINPFNFAQRGRGDESSYDLVKTSPNQAIDYTIGVMGHEILHDMFGHGAEMQYAEVQLARVIADIRPELEEILRRAYDPGATGRIRPDLATALAIYQESRGRKERERDVLGGQALADRPEQPTPPDEVRPIGGVTPARTGDVRLGTGGAGGERVVKPPVERWQWLRDEGHGRSNPQRAGNRTAIFELNEPLYNTFIKPRLRPGYAVNLAEYQTKHPGARYISLTQVGGEGPKTFDRVGTLEELRPTGEQLKWAKRVSSFDSTEAKEWSALSDAEVYHAEATERGERPHEPARVQEAGRPGAVVGEKGTRGTPRSVSETGERPGARPRRTGGKRLEDVAPVKIDAQVVRQTPPVRDLEEWREALRAARLPEVIPQPTQKLSPDVARKMKYEGQVEVAEAMLSEMVDGSGGFLLAVGTGGGKSYEASAVAAELKKRGLLNYGMVVVPNKILGKMWEDVMAHYGVMAQSLPSGVTAPPGKGVWIVTDASLAQRANIRKAGVRKILEDGGLAEFPWDLAIVDEADRSRKHQISDRGMVVKRLGEKSSRMIYATATPFHSAVDFGYLEKLGLWRYSGFDKWIRQFPGVHQDDYGYWEGGHNPWMLAKLRMQLLERGQMITQLADYSGFTVNFGVVPLSTQQQQTLADIKTAFTLALNYFKAARRFTQVKPTLGHAVMFAKDYLERARLPQLIEVAKKGEAQGFKVEFFSARRSEVTDIYNFLKEADEGLDGRISALLPKLPDVVKTLKDAFGDDLANFSGPDSPERTQELKDFQSGKKKHIFATYDAGARGIGMHDTVGDAPRLLLLVGLPWSAFQFDQSFGRPWRFGTKSNVVAIVLTSNAKAEFQMVTAKVGPRLQSLDAAVRGVDQTTPAAKRFADLDGRLAYDLGMKTKTDMDELSTTVDDKGIIANYSDINIPDASNLKNKGINVKERVQGPPSIGSMRMGLVPDPELIAATITRLRDRMKAAMEGNSVMPPPGERTKEDDQIEYMLSGLNMAETIPDEEERDIFADSANSLAEEAATGAEDPTPAFVSVWRGITKWISTKDNKPPQGVAGGKGLLPFFIMHGREIIRRRGGEIGMIIADDKIPKYHVIAENVSGRYSDRLMGIMEKYALSKDERTNAFYVTEGREVPINQKVADAAREWRVLDNEIGDQLEAEGIQVETIDRKTGRKTFVPFRKLANHMPHMYDKEVLDISSKRYKDAVKRTMERYGIDRAAAEKRIQERADRGVRLAGNVERHRNRDIEGYDATVDAYLRYLQQVGEAIARKRVFGQFREKLSGLIATMPDAEDRKTVTHIMDQLLDVNPTSEEIKKAVQKVYGYTIMTKMFTSALPGMADFVRAGLYASNRAMLRSARDIITDYSGARKRAFRSGVLNQYIKQRILEEWGVDPTSKTLGVAAEKWLEYIGYVAVDRTGRIFTDGVARNFLTLEALPALMRSESILTRAIKSTPVLRKLEVGHEHWRRILREHYQLKDEQIDAAIQRGFWTEEELDAAASALSDKVQYTHDPTELPPAMRAISKDKPGQAASAAMRMTLMLKSTLFKQTYTLKDGLIRELKKGNMRPWIPFFTWSPLLGELVLDLLNIFRGDPERFMQLWESETWEPGNLLRRIADNVTYGAGQTTVSVLWGMISKGIDVIDWIAPAALNDLTTFFERVVAPGAQDLVNGNPDKTDERFLKWAVSRFPGARFTKQAVEKFTDGEDGESPGVFVVEPPPIEIVEPPPVSF